MKRVTFETAKAIKEVGYPQDNVKYVHKVKSFPMYYNGDYVPDYEYFYLNYISDFDFQFCVAAPTYLEVWLWLWREKNIKYEIVKSGDKVLCKEDPYKFFYMKDPEEAIIAAIEYLVENNLIK